MDKAIEAKIRHLKISQLEILKLLVNSKDGISSSKEIGETTQTATYSLGAVITPLRRIRNVGGTIIEPVGRKADNSVRWKINVKVVDRNELRALLVDMNI